MSMILLTIIILITAGIGGYYYLKNKPTDEIIVKKNSLKSTKLSDTKRKLDDQFNIANQKKQQEIDRILDKINRKGLESLSKIERAFLDKNSSS